MPPVEHNLELTLRVNGRMLTVRDSFGAVGPRARAGDVLKALPGMYSELLRALERMQEREPN